MSMKKRFALSSGKLIDVDNIKVEDINLEDIAHHLSKIQRYNGALPIDVTYSVAEHSISLCNYLNWNLRHQSNPDIARWGLIHDAAEALLGDVFPSLKSDQYKELENKVNQMIFNKYIRGSVYYYRYLKEKISMCDKRMVIDEVEAIIPEKLDIYKSENDVIKLGCHIEFNNHPSTVKHCFLQLCKKLGIKD